MDYVLPGYVHSPGLLGVTWGIRDRIRYHLRDVNVALELNAVPAWDWFPRHSLKVIPLRSFPPHVRGLSLDGSRFDASISGAYY